MNTFDQILLSMGLGGGINSVETGNSPNLKFKYNAGGHGYEASLVIELASNPTTHITIFKSTWDGEGRDPVYGESPLGPGGMHLTYPGRHIFYKVEDAGDVHTAWCLTDGTSSREELTFRTLFDQIKPHL